MESKRIFTTLLLLITVLVLKAQETTNKVRVYELLDITEQENKVFAADFNPINKIIYEAAVYGRKGIHLTAYKDTTFSSSYTKSELKKMGGKSIETQYAPYPDDPTYLLDTVIYEPFDPLSLYDFVLMEDSITVGSKDTPVVKYQIIAIAPIIYDQLEAHLKVNYHPMFWVKYDELQPLLAREIFMSYINRDGRLKYDYLFEKRFFKTKTPMKNFRF